MMASRRIGWWVLCGHLYSKCHYLEDKSIVECCSFLIFNIVLLDMYLNLMPFIIQLNSKLFSVLSDELVLILYYMIPLFDVLYALIETKLCNINSLGRASL